LFAGGESHSPRRGGVGEGFLDRAYADCHLSCCFVDRVVEVVDDVGDVFDADREADEVGGDAGGGLLFVGELLVGGGGGVDDERLGVADVGEEGEELDVVD
jgi:hypothetical protein